MIQFQYRRLNVKEQGLRSVPFRSEEVPKVKVLFIFTDRDQVIHTEGGMGYTLN